MRAVTVASRENCSITPRNCKYSPLSLPRVVNVLVVHIIDNKCAL